MDKSRAKIAKPERARPANTVQVDLTVDEKRRLKAHCARKGVTMSKWIAEVIRSAMKED